MNLKYYRVPQLEVDAVPVYIHVRSALRSLRTCMMTPGRLYPNVIFNVFNAVCYLITLAVLHTWHQLFACCSTCVYGRLQTQFSELLKFKVHFYRMCLQNSWMAYCMNCVSSPHMCTPWRHGNVGETCSNAASFSKTDSNGLNTEVVASFYSIQMLLYFDFFQFFLLENKQ